MCFSFLEIMLLLFMFATLFVLALGIGVMLKGGKLNQKYGSKLMRWRVFLQGISLALLALVILRKGL
ncbi:MAG: hypothetical protein CMM87_03765 [Rickettsiales bacterium]|nr:hypothetical protein [Rickettsiales bacterium]